MTETIGASTDSTGNPPVHQWIQSAYSRLYEIAAKRMGRENPGQTLTATALINEVFVRLSRSNEMSVNNESHFLAIASVEMSRVLIEIARQKKALKRGGEFHRVALDDESSNAPVPDRVLEIHEAIDELETTFPEKAMLVRLRYILGLSEAEAAEAMNISRATASRHWKFARAWLLEKLS